MKKFAVVAMPLLAALAVVVYVVFAERPAGPGDAGEAAPAQEREPSGDLPEADTAGAGGEEKRGAAERRFARTPIRHGSKSGAETEFILRDGEIGYVDVDSVVQDRDPYSVIALLQAYRDITGAGESLEIEIEGVSERPGGHTVYFNQLIEGKSTEGRGYLNIDSSGAVGKTFGVLFDTQAARPGSVEILRPEAEAIAREAAVRYAASLPVIPARRGRPLRMDIHPGELRYGRTADNELRAEWRMRVSIYGQKVDDLEVLVAAETGKVVSVASTMVDAAAPCSKPAFRVCDGAIASKLSCEEGDLNSVTPVLDGEKCVAKNEKLCEAWLYKGPKKEAEDAIDYVQQRNSDSVKGMGGEDCKIDILVNYPLPKNVGGGYNSGSDVILISGDVAWGSPKVIKRTTAHEVFHAVSKGGGEVEHGLVYAMDAIYMGGEKPEWDSYEGGERTDLTGKQVIYKGDTRTVVGHAMYRVYKKLGKDKAFEFALAVDKTHYGARSLSQFRTAMVDVAEDLGVEDEILEVLWEMGITDAPAHTVPYFVEQFILEKYKAILKNPDELSTLYEQMLKDFKKWLKEVGLLDKDDVMQ